MALARSLSSLKFASWAPEEVPPGPVSLQPAGGLGWPSLAVFSELEAGPSFRAAHGQIERESFAAVAAACAEPADSAWVTSA